MSYQSRSNMFRSWVSRRLAGPLAAAILAPVTRRRVVHKGLSINTSSPSFTRSIRAQLFWGIYESAETRFIQSHLHKERTVLELGTSLGVTAAHIISAMPEGGRLICVEPNAEIHLSALATLKPLANAKGINLTLHPFAIGKDGQQGQLRQRSSTLETTVGFAHAKDGADAIRVASLDTIVAESIGDKPFALITDIEGAEASFLMPGLSNAMRRCNLLIAELHDTTVGEKPVSVAQLRASIEETWGLRIIAERGPVIAARR